MLREYRLVGHVAVLCDKPGQGFFERLHALQTTGEDPYRVAFTELGGNRSVSTVFLGIDHNFSRAGEPHLFESMIFTHSDANLFERCTTWEQAEAMHERAVAFAKTGHLRIVK